MASATGFVLFDQSFFFNNLTHLLGKENGNEE
jgi:hypothetical protein